MIASGSIFLWKVRIPGGVQLGNIVPMVNLENTAVTIHGWLMVCGSLTLKGSLPT